MIKQEAFDCAIGGHNRDRRAIGQKETLIQ
jgi:hypothetical protein